MMVMTAKVDLKKILIAVGIVAGVIIGAIMLLGGGDSDASATSAPAVSGNDARVKFLKDFGWDAAATPVESSQVRIPEKTTEVYDRYNALQKSQGFDLTAYAGKNVMRYVYKINNFPGATEPVYATLLVYKNQIIGGDITNTGTKGHIQGFKMPENTQQPSASLPPATAPSPEPSSTGETGAATAPSAG